ncbi:mono-functional DNA-alkylating methyl methanesulfonate N-term-domain-containing protein [Aspergillus cavernicola]|uniref:Mono-functional DNA-alkylating methyl methanesulfonate N-term-domain-containing protein n=1 Tax=Aspergillus cavernicola TaxID=176166 RepID=A0ABR4IIX7_9EURO
MSYPRNTQGLAPHLPNTSAKQPSGDKMDIDSSSSASKAKIGLLTHTLVSSPIIQWILPAHLRSKDQNDVVFVGERSLQIKEAILGTHLEEVTSKSDFDAYIMAAKVINISTELPWEAQMRLGSSSTDATSELQKDLPPQIMVLSLASKELVFLYYSNIAGQFIHYHRPLPSDVSTFERFGRNIAVEPRSRAVAVSASCDYFGVFILKTPPALQAQMAENKLDPVAEERFFRVEGDIIFVEFLYPRPEDGDKIILLLLVSKAQTTHAICYEWNANQALRQAHPRITKKPLPPQDRLPTMLIPLTKAASFILVTTTSMTIYKNKLDFPGDPIEYPLPAPDREQQRSPLWTRWARPLRNWLYNQKHDDIYLCREDGRVDYLGIGNEGEVENRAQLGHLFCDVDAAFDILNIGYDGGDLLLATGNTGDGGLFVQKARDQPRCVQRFMNWSPVTDSVIVRPPQSPGAVIDDVTGDRLFVCSASSFGRGAVVELRHGIEAQIGLVISLEELAGARDIWILPDSANGGVFMLTSDPVSSTILYLPAHFDEEISAVDETECGLDPNAPTLAAGYLKLGALVQVTDKAIFIGATTEPQSNIRSDLGLGQSVAAAAVHGPTSLVVTAIRTEQGMHVHLKNIVLVGAKIELSDMCPPFEIDYEPLCMTIEELDIGTLVFIGTGDGRVRVYHIGGYVKQLVDVAVTVENGDDISKAIDGLTMMAHTTEKPLNKATLLCGLRSGFLVMFEMTIDADNTDSPFGMQQAALRHLGHTSVRVQGRRNAALLTCGSGFWQATCSQGDEASECAIQRIWITDQHKPAYFPQNIHCFAMISPADTDINGLSGSLFCIADGQLMICTLDKAVKTIPRTINTPGSANKVAYSQHLRCLVVAYTRTTLETDADPVKRYTRPYIEFLDPDSQHPLDGATEGVENQMNKPWRPQGAAGEKISCILEWTPRKGDEEYHFIVIGTARKNQQERGRVIFLQASRDATTASQIECTVKYIHRFEGPVYSIVPYGDFTLMVSTGHEIVALEPKIGQPRRARSARFSVLSPAISMSSHEPYVYISTARESLLVLKATEDELALRAYDRQKHDGLSHIHIGGDANLTLSSSRGGRVSLLTEDGVTDTDKMMPTALCEAHLPSSVMKLSSSSKPSPLSSSSQIFYGTAMNGTVYRFLTLGEKEWRLLRLLQDLCIRDPIICPFTPRRKRQRNPVGHEPLEFQPSYMHIDGDILSRLVTRDFSYLRRMLVGEEGYNSSTVKTGPAQAVVERFTELAQDVLGESSTPVELVMRWLKRVFHVEF